MWFLKALNPVYRLTRQILGLPQNHRVFLFPVTVLIFSVITEAAGVCVSGTVTDEAGEPINKAKLYLIEKEWEIYTNEEGTFQFDCSPVYHKVNEAAIVRPVVRNGMLSFTITGTAKEVLCEIFTLTGKRVRRITGGSHQPESYNYDLKFNEFAAGSYLLSLRIGASVQIIRMVLSDNGWWVNTGTNGMTTSGNALQKSATTFSDDQIDQLICTAEGYERQLKPVSSYADVIDFTMKVDDTTPPLVTFFEGEDTVQVHYNDDNAIDYWFDEDSMRVIAVDDIDSEPDLMPPIQTTINRTKPGFTTIRHGARDDNGNIGYAYRLMVLHDSTVTDDKEPPEIIFSHNRDTLHLVKGSLFDPDTGVTAVDVVDTMVDLTSWIAVSDNIETTRERTAYVTVDVPGTYTVTYKIIDTSLNLAMRERIIVVEEPLN